MPGTEIPLGVVGDEAEESSSRQGGRSGRAERQGLLAPVGSVLHPLLHENTSDLLEQRFSSTFTGEEFFLRDHTVQGRRVLPGMACLEMARAAVERAVRIPPGTQRRIRLKNVVWTRPVIVGDKAVRLHIGIFPQEDGEIAYEIYSGFPGADPAQVVHSQGIATVSSGPEAARWDLAVLQAECNQGVLSGDQCYGAFAAMGIEYGPGHQGIEEVYVGQDQVLARLALPSAVAGTQDQFVLHPSLLDAALQASIGLQTGVGEAPPKPVLPFALGELEVLGNCAAGMWAVVRYSRGSKAGDRAAKLDIDLCDETGKVCVRMKAFTFRFLEGDLPTANPLKAIPSETSLELPAGTVRLTPVWDVINPYRGQTFPSPHARVVITGGDKDNWRAIRQHYPKAQVLEIQPGDTIEPIAYKLGHHTSIDHIMWIAPCHALKSLTDDTLIEQQEQGVLQVFRMVKALLRLGYGAKGLGWTIITTKAQPISKDDKVNPVHASLHGLVGSMAKEYPNWKIRLIDLDDQRTWPIDDIFTLPPDPQGNPVVYRGQCWYRQRLIFLHSPNSYQKLYRPQGVYVVIGGTGGIGEVWSEYMIRTYRARVVWIGRRPKDEAIQAKLDKLAALGSAPFYLTADATDQEALQKAYAEIKERYPRINGVIHSAIVLSDQTLTNMEEEQFRAGLSAKVDVSVQMARVFNQEPLDFALFFSSMNSFFKPPGQSNYASGCTFEDAFAHQLAHEWPCAVKVINWGYWGSVGIVASRAYQDRMAQAGIGSIEAGEAMDTLEMLLAGQVDQVALMKTTKPLAMDGVNPQEQITFYPESIHSHIQDLKNRIPDQAPRLLKSGRERRQEMDELLCQLLLGQLQAMDLLTEKGSGTKGLRTKTGLRDIYDRWFQESTAVLTRYHYFTSDQEAYTVKEQTPIEAAWEEWEAKKRSWLIDPASKAQVTLVEATLRALPDILAGKTLATDVMFPDSSMALVEGVYKNNPVADYFNQTLADILVNYIEERLGQDPSTRIRLIEMGAGTGGTSACVFQKLKPFSDHIQEYCYTDISKAFLMHAEKEYGPDNPYLTCRVFDVEAPLAGQNIQAGGYDIAIAANVLHATRNIRHTLRNAKATLKRNGLLLLNEISGKTLFTHLTFGLLEGWWLYEDAGLRLPGCPGLSPQTWQTVLESEGIRSVFFPAQEAHEFGQQIIVAESDGVVRQKHQPEATSTKQKVVTRTVKKQAYQQEYPAAQPVVTQDLLREKGTSYFKKLIGDTIEIPSDEIDSSEPLEKYGIDSILVIQLTKALQEVFGDISSVLFFEYQTIDALVEYFITTQRDSVVKLVGLAEQELDKEPSGGETLALSPSVLPDLAFGKSGRFFEPHSNIDTKEPLPSRVQDVAIIGLSGRYPGANNLNEYWNILKEGRNCITEVPQDRWNWEAYFNEDKGKAGSIYTKWGGFIEDIDKFDPLFFQISPREAEQMDPQERLFLEVAYASIEDAGYTPANLSESRKIGVFVGVMNGNYPTGPRYWSIANRISYFMNFQGPSLAVDTACSSSLTAIHLALDSLHNGLSECAIVGGVNLVVDPIHYMRLTAVKMLSPGNQCKSFGDQADGFVDGEGVGAIVLKPLSKAIADGDHIYGVIKGSMLNAGGKTNGYTVPNPHAQSRVIAEALQRAKIHPRMISYIEAHGTGTSLGDPIEIAGLSKVFEEYTKEKQYCAIGSVKSNIGHCESASGIAGVTKVLLQLKHGQLVPSLHSLVLNPNIDFKNTPFIVQQELAEWKRPVVESNGEIKEYPRIAGISSFGAGGANAHVLIEEYIAKGVERPHIPITTRNPAIAVLSAKNEERLKEQVRRLIAAIDEDQLSDPDLPDMAYTLQVGREAMEERLALIVGSMAQLAGKLRMFLEGASGIAGLYRGQVGHNKDTLAIFSEDEDMAMTIEAWVLKGKYDKLASLWVKGLDFDWNRLYTDIKPQRISLPTYPFTKERYWFPQTTEKAVVQNRNTLHPLLHENTSDFSELRFSSTFTGTEFFLRDHVVKGRRVLPETAQLEMARAAAYRAAGVLQDGRTGLRLQNVAWAGPIVVDDQPVKVDISLFPGDNGEIIYEIHSTSEETSRDSIVHSQGRATFSQLDQPRRLPLRNVQSQCSHATLSPAQCYDVFTAAGVGYGPGYRGIEKVFVGRNQVLAKISLPPSILDTGDQFGLHPTLLESALQASVGLIPGAGDPGGPRFLITPVSMEEAEISANHSSVMWAWIRYSETGTVMDEERRLDLDLCDEQGNVCIRMRGIEFADPEETGKEVQESSGSFGGTENLIATSVNHLKFLIAEETKIPVSKLDPQADFGELGLDSVMIARLNEKVEKWCGKSDVALFFKYHTVESLGTYFAETYPDRVAALMNKAAAPLPARQPAGRAALSSLRTAGNYRKEVAASVSEPGSSTDIAVIGVAGRYPQAASLDEFWRNLCQGKDCVQEIPADRWSLAGFYEPDRYRAVAKGLSYSKWGGFLEDFDCFDPLFFNISPRDAMFMDPQERLFLEIAWECLEDAGYTRESIGRDTYGNRVGVFVGASFNNYQLCMAEAALRANQAMYPANSQIFSIGNRVSYVMNFTGPSLTVDTACSSSLYAIHLACESIASGRCRLALAGGVNLSLHPSKYITLSMGQFNAADGRCHSFGEGGTGYVPSEAVGAVLMKPLPEAIRDNDIIYGIIKGTAVSHVGKTGGYTVPSPVSQSLVIEEALRRSRIHPRTISCLEAHGTGTALGDPIEVAGLTDAFRKYTQDAGFCSISSVKSNIGHSEAAAGIAQLTKVLLQFKHRTLVKNVMHGRGANPHISLAQTPFVLQENTEYWQPPVIDGREVPRRAGISSFGAGGSCAHIVVEEYAGRGGRETEARTTTSQPVLVVLSARKTERLKEMARRLLVAIEEGRLSDDRLVDVAYTLQVGREAHKERLAVIVQSVRELADRLKEFLGSEDGIGIENMYRGQVISEKDVTVEPAADRELTKSIDLWLHNGEYSKLADLWVRGIAFDWQKLYREGKPSRTSLPTYPFARERYWVGGHADKPAENVPGSVPAGSGAGAGTAEPFGIPGAMDAEATSEAADRTLRQHIKEVIIGELSQALEVDASEIDADERFTDYGLDSINAVQMVQAINQTLALDLDAQVAVEYDSVNGLAAYILSLLAGPGDSRHGRGVEGGFSPNGVGQRGGPPGGWNAFSGLSMIGGTKNSKLFERTEINGMAVANRFVRSATWEGMATEEGAVSPKLTETLVNLAKGGVGLLISGHSFVRPEGQGGRGQLGIYKDELVPGLKEMTAAVHNSGGRIVMQLSHAGKFALKRVPGQPLMVVSLYDESGKTTGTERHEITRQDIREIVAAFAYGALRAKNAGFDGVQIHSAHGYLLSQFLSPAFNRRQDEYGGDIYNRSRIHIEVCRAIRELVGRDYPVMIKLNCSDFVENGLTLEESLQVASKLADAGLDAIELSGGLLTGGKLSPSRPGIECEAEEAYFRQEARYFKKTIDIPLILVGGIRSFQVAESLVEHGMADYVSMSRPLIREPDLVSRWQSGNHSRSQCKSDNLCYGSPTRGNGIYCVTKNREEKVRMR